MKKRFTLFMLVAFCISLATMARNTVVSSSAEFGNAWGALTDGDTISFAPGLMNIGNRTLPATGGTFTFRSQYDHPDSMAIVQLQISGVNTEEGITTGLIFENLHLQYRSPSSTSGQIIYFNKVYADISIVAFRNCEISQSVRSLIRTVKPSDIPATDSTEAVEYTSSGDLEYLEMTDCIVHNTFASSSHNWPLLYFGHLPIEVYIARNTFYDMPYNKSIFTMNYAVPELGRNAEITFENNTVCITGPTQGIVVTGTYLGQESEFNFHNNLFLVPYWENDLNLHDSLYSAPRIISCRYGIINASHNLVEGYARWESGQNIDAETGDGAFLALDTMPQYTMADLELSWSDFLNPEGGDYSYMYNIPLATAGSDGGPIGDPRWVMTFADPKNLTLVSNAEGAVVTPAMGVYESGTEVTISASEVVGFTFQNWQDTLGNVVSAENPYTFNITSDTYLVAYYEELLSRAITIRLNGTNTATYSLSPAREIYYVGDEVTITVNAHYLNDFLGWSDGSKELSRSFVVANDTTIVANFRQYPYMLAWDFCQLTANNTRFSSLEANHYVNEANKGEMNYVTGDTLAADFQTRNNKFTAEGKELHYSALRRTPAANFDNPDYLFVKFSTLGYTHITVKSAIASDNCVHLVQKMQYSLNGTDYIDFAVDTLPSAEADWNQVWFPLQGTLPKEAQNREEVYVRWIADKTSERVKLASLEEVAYEYLYISQIVILGNDGNGGASWRVKPYDYYLAGDVVEVPGIKLTLGGGTNVWSVSDSVFVFDGVTYISALNGTVNPVDANNKKFSSSGLAPTVGAFYKFEPSRDGTLDVALVVNPNKTSFIIEDNVALSDYNAFSYPVKTYISFKLNLTAGKTYHIFSEGSKMGIMGFVYEIAGGLGKAELSTQIFANNGSLFVKLNKAESIKVYDLLGRTVKSLELREGLNEINGLSRGIYLVRLGSETVKIQL
ncbi:MAG TPA: hypothetical protein PK994_05685 [Bacteroidales bacterium]|nr:hypothetical protein [Bacteroidales bacterium]